ncbi:MAG: hypothetical protein KAI89_11570 [Emcibacter sp.]|nr:hypothetical protein [Emcibacter sp.]
MKKILLATTIAALAIPSVALAAKYTEAPVANGGSVVGKITFSGDDPAPQTYAVTKDNAVCGDAAREIDFVKVNNGALNDVVVYLDKVKTGKAFPALDIKVDQKACAFDPYFTVMHNEGTIEATNSDSVMHNIHTYEMIGRAKKTAFNVSQPEPGTITKAVKFKRGSGMKIECDAHDFMHSFVFVAKNPYYAVVNADGTFEIGDVPAGTYKIKTWHGTLGENKGKVTVTAGGSVTWDFEYK